MMDSFGKREPTTLFPTSMDAQPEDTHWDLEQPRSRRSAALAAPIAYAVCVAVVAVVGAALVIGDSSNRLGRATNPTPMSGRAAAASQLIVAPDATEVLAPRDATMFLDGATINMPAPIGATAADVRSAEVHVVPAPPLAKSSEPSKP